MEVPQRIFSKLEKKFVLLDTNVLIGASTNFEAYQSVFELLEQEGCALAHFSFVEFEFVRGAFEPENMEKRREFFGKIQSQQIGCPVENIVSDAISIANAYARKKHNSASFVDCCVAAYLKRFSGLLLLTEDHKDFPLFLFNRIHVLTVDTGRDIHTPSFYQYDESKAKRIGVA